IPFPLRDDADEADLPDDLRAWNVPDRAFVDFHRHGARDGRTDPAGMDHAGHLEIGDVVLLTEDLRRDVCALHRLSEDLVVLRRFWLRLAGSIERVADLFVPF